MEEIKEKWYVLNLKNKHMVADIATENLLDRIGLKEALKIENFNEIGIVEYVAHNNFKIINNRIVPEEC